MKKVKYVALILVLAFGLIGGAYAAWTDSVTLTSTVTSGTVDVRVQEGKYLPTIVVSGSEAAYMDASVSNTEDSITFNINNLYPVSQYNKGVALKASMRNYGTVPVKLDSIDFTMVNPDSPAWKYLRIYGHVALWKYNGESVSPTAQWTKTFQHVYLKDLKTVLEEKLAGEVIEPGYIISFDGVDEDGNTIYIYLLGKDDNGAAQGESVGFTAVFNWKQFNL